MNRSSFLEAMCSARYRARRDVYWRFPAGDLVLGSAGMLARKPRGPTRPGLRPSVPDHDHRIRGTTAGRTPVRDARKPRFPLSSLLPFVALGRNQTIADTLGEFRAHFRDQLGPGAARDKELE